MATDEHYDVVIIGSGQAALPLLAALAREGRKAALIERGPLGGTCINYGCTPTKTMVGAARLAYSARRAGEFGIRVGEVTTDMEAVRQLKRDTVADFVKGRESAAAGAKGADVLRGEASFVGPKLLEVRMNAGGTLRVSADTIVLDTGTRPAMPDLPGIDTVAALDSTAIMELDVLPDHLLILGGGYVGLEFAQMFRRFGSKVTVIQRGQQLLGREDADIAEAMAAILTDDGIDVLLHTNAVRVASAADGTIDFTVAVEGQERALNGSHLLVASGRIPNVEALNLAAAGVKTDKRGFIAVGAHLETNVAGIYAVGDVNGGPQFTHIAYDDYRILCDNLIYGGKLSTEGRMVPYVVFTDPQLGRVGMTEQEARAAGRKIKVARCPMNWVARAIELKETRGVLKAIVDADSEEILGCAMLSMEGGEMMAMIQIAMMGKLKYPVLRDAIFAHPTLSESLNTLFSNFDE